MFYEKLYQIDDDTDIYTRHNLLLLLRSSPIEANNPDFSITEYCNVHHAYENFFGSRFSHLSKISIVAQAVHHLTDFQVSDLIIQGQNLVHTLHQKINKWDYLCLKYNQEITDEANRTGVDNYSETKIESILRSHFNQKDYDWINFHEKLPNPIEPVPITLENRWFGNTSTSNYYGYPLQKSHSAVSYKSGRVNHPQHAFAVDNYESDFQRKQLAKQYPNAKIGHLNRRHRKNHPIDFPMFDDVEYIEARKSSSYKSSTKAPKSYLQHAKQHHFHRRDFNQKRLLAKQLNDWSNYDVEAMKSADSGISDEEIEWLNQPVIKYNNKGDFKPNKQ